MARASAVLPVPGAPMIITGTSKLANWRAWAITAFIGELGERSTFSNPSPSRRALRCSSSLVSTLRDR